MTKYEMVIDIFSNKDIPMNAPVQKFVDAAEKKFKTDISPNLVSTVRQRIIRGQIKLPKDTNVPNNQVVTPNQNGTTEIMQILKFADDVGGLQRLSQLTQQLLEVKVKW